MSMWNVVFVFVVSVSLLFWPLDAGGAGIMRADKYLCNLFIFETMQRSSGWRPGGMGSIMS